MKITLTRQDVDRLFDDRVESITTSVRLSQAEIRELARTYNGRLTCEVSLVTRQLSPLRYLSRTFREITRGKSHGE